MKRQTTVVLGLFMLILIYTRFYQDKKHIDNNIILVKNNPTKSNINQNSIIINKEKITKVGTLPSLKNPHTSTQAVITTTKQTKKAQYLAYLKYREEYNNDTVEKTNQYLNYQKKLRLKREGGVKVKLNKEKENTENRFKQQYKSQLTFNKRTQQKNFMKQKTFKKQRQADMQSLREKQMLQTKYRGE